MKEATGELSTTVIAVVAIAAVAAIFTIVMLPMLKRSIALSAACTSSGGGDYSTCASNDTGGCVNCSGDSCTYVENGVNKASKTCKKDY